MKYLWPALIWAVLIFAASAMPAGVVRKMSWVQFFSADKLAHAVIYGVFAHLLLRAWVARTESGYKARHAWYTLALCTVYGVAMEVFQYTCFAGRYFEFMDIIANIIGSVFGIIFFVILNKR